ncbi:unnamed protein product [Ostreobium quekettii]|uniref:Uncharacterized protein n=1 Tax=Ostreobium quekettii TaxID=121088 RepID=A0A8S1IMW2_9CHLO|nr:unnamed protein product [Ostreobium quekettii]
MDTEGEEQQDEGWPDAIVVVMVQFLLGIAIATGAVPPKVLGMQARGAETIGIVVLLTVTGASAFTIRDRLGRHDMESREYIVTVLAPIVTRLDLGLLIWTNLNKALVWAEQVVFMAEAEELSNKLLNTASWVWHDGEDRIQDPEFGMWGGDAATLMYRVLEAFNPMTALSNVTALLGHVTLWPIAALLFLALQIVSIVGWLLFWMLAQIARLTGRYTESKDPQKRVGAWRIKKRTTVYQYLVGRQAAQKNALYIRHEVAWLADSQMHKINGDKRRLRYTWAMLAGVDARAGHPHFHKLFQINYPMRANRVLNRASVDQTCNDVLTLLNREQILYPNLPDKPLSGIGEPASRQVVLYRAMAWPEVDDEARATVERAVRLAEINTQEWRIIGSSLTKVEQGLFSTFKDILRRWLVQILMIVWCDGAAEARHDGVTDVPLDLAQNYEHKGLNGIELGMRILGKRPAWVRNHEYGFLSMIGSLVWRPPSCSWNLCTEMDQRDKLPDKRYQQTPSVAELRDQLTAVNCQRAAGLCTAWHKGVVMWLRYVYEGKEWGRKRPATPPKVIVRTPRRRRSKELL